MTNNPDTQTIHVEPMRVWRITRRYTNNYRGIKRPVGRDLRDAWHPAGLTITQGTRRQATAVLTRHLQTHRAEGVDYRLEYLHGNEWVPA